MSAVQKETVTVEDVNVELVKVYLAGFRSGCGLLFEFSIKPIGDGLVEIELNGAPPLRQADLVAGLKHCCSCAAEVGTEAQGEQDNNKRADEEPTYDLATEEGAYQLMICSMDRLQWQQNEAAVRAANGGQLPEWFTDPNGRITGRAYAFLSQEWREFPTYRDSKGRLHVGVTVAPACAAAARSNT
jgi:hypothetical protein